MSKIMSNEKIHYAVFSGFCAGAAGLFGKLSGLPTFEGLLMVRIILFCIMLICNAGVWTLFVKALQHTNSSLTATVTSAAANYIFSAAAGFFVFGEITTLIWWSGMLLIILGLLLIAKNSQEVKKNT